mmetsp:Transcript_42352/g.133450  ORF Transcript_42352/g.133450 Transcript_42352/m.133450 type:complete len:214 (+) Transcript_42352:1435-2076(+)
MQVCCLLRQRGVHVPGVLPAGAAAGSGKGRQRDVGGRVGGPVALPQVQGRLLGELLPPRSPEVPGETSTRVHARVGGECGGRRSGGEHGEEGDRDHQKLCRGGRCGRRQAGQRGAGGGEGLDATGVLGQGRRHRGMPAVRTWAGDELAEASLQEVRGRILRHVLDREDPREGARMDEPGEGVRYLPGDPVEGGGDAGEHGQGARGGSVAGGLG